LAELKASASNRFKRTGNAALYTEVYEPRLTSATPPQVAVGYTILGRSSGITI